MSRARSGRCHRWRARLIVSFIELARRARALVGERQRYAHSVRVARLAGRLASAHGEDAVAARVAGLLHDVARLYSEERLLAESTARALPIGAFERSHPVVLHAPLGAEIVRERFGIEDVSVLNAIRRHTLARAGMSRLDVILYLADGLEPGRTFRGREALTALAFKDLDAAMGELLRSTLAYLQERKLTAAPQTLAALDHYQSLERRPLSA